MEKRQIIDTFLKSNVPVNVGLGTSPEDGRKVIVAGITPGQGHNSLYYYVAPEDGLYTASTLNRFMLSLVPSLKPDQIDPFDLKPGYRWFGSDYRYGELAGKDLTLVLTYGALWFRDKSTDSKETTAIFVGPDKTLVSKTDPKYGPSRCISLDDLESYLRPGSVIVRSAKRLSRILRR